MAMVTETVRNVAINGVKGAFIGGTLCSSPFLILLLWEFIRGKGNIPGEISSNAALKIKNSSMVTNRQIGIKVTCGMFLYGLALGGTIGAGYGIVKSINSFFYKKDEKNSVNSAQAVQAPPHQFSSKKTI